MILPIVTYGDPILRKQGYSIKEKTKELDELINNMFETLHHTDGIGLAAHQVGRPLSLFVINYDRDPSYLKEVFINPIIIESSVEEVDYPEGCLSVPGIMEIITRPKSITIKYLDQDFNQKEVTYEDILARVIEHEYDHIMGRLFIDKLIPLKKKILSGKLKNIMKKKFSINYRTK